MSIEVMKWAWDVEDITHAMKLVLMALADQAGEEHSCFPGQAFIAKRCCMSRSAVNKNLAKLEEAGLITIKERTHDGSRAKRSSVYRLAAPLGDKARSPMQEMPGHVYVVTSGNDTKVGATKNLDLSIKTLNSQSSDGVNLIRVFDMNMSRARRVARLLNEHFADARISGDWLDVSEAVVIRDIEQVIEGNLDVSEEHTRDDDENDNVMSDEDISYVDETQGMSFSDHTDVSAEDNFNPKEPSSEPKQEPKKSQVVLFDEFWKAYPNKVGKGAARRCFEKVMKDKLVEFDVMMDALRKYANKTDDRAFCNPATWLNQERWEDEPARGTTGSLASRLQSQKRAAI